jgi:hypothetical protein
MGLLDGFRLGKLVLESIVDNLTTMDDFEFWGLTSQPVEGFRISFTIRISDLKKIYPNFDFTGYVIVSGGFSLAGGVVDPNDDNGVNYMSTDHSGPLPDNGYACSVTVVSKQPFKFNAGLLYRKPKSKPTIPPPPPGFIGSEIFKFYY